jgi:hypothetical protein
MGSRSQKSPYLWFHKLPTLTNQKTSRWWVYSTHSDETLAVISWYGPWRQYCVTEWLCKKQMWSSGCAHELGTFLEKVNCEHREALKRNR